MKYAHKLKGNLPAMETARKTKYGLRKLSVGVVSYFLGCAIFFGTGNMVHAEENSSSSLTENSATLEIDETTSNEESTEEDAVAPNTDMAIERADNSTLPDQPVMVNSNMASQYNPKGKEIVAYVGDSIEPLDGIQNPEAFDLLPKGTTVTWTYGKPSTDNLLNKAHISITLTYPDKSTDIVPSALTVLERPVNPPTEENKEEETHSKNIAIDEANFPDAEFRNYIQDNFDTDNDNTLSETEVQNITSIVIEDNRDLQSVKGIELFSELKELDLYHTSISDLDVSKNINLESLRFIYNKTDGIDLSKNANLKELRIGPLLWYNIGNNPDLAIPLSYDTLSFPAIIGNTFNLAEYAKGIDLSRIISTENGTLDKTTGVFTIDDISQPFSYEYDCGIAQKGRHILKVTKKAPIVNNLPKIIAQRVTLYVGETYNPLENVSANDKEDGDIVLTEENIIENDVDTSRAGIYHVTYQVTDSQGGDSMQRITVTVKDKTEISNTAPTISANDVTLYIGDTFDPLSDVSAIDQEDGDIFLTEENITENDVDTSKAGTYHVTYKVKDKNSATTEKTINVTVKEKVTNNPVNPQQTQKSNINDNTTKTADKEQSSKPNITKSDLNKTDIPQTGDTTHVVAVLGSLLISLSVLLALLRKKRS